MKSWTAENARIALKSIRSQLLRTILTILIIAIGIAAMVGTLTAIDAIRSAVNENFMSMGANTFTIRNRGTNVRIGRDGRRAKEHKPISYEEAAAFRQQFDFPAAASLSTFGTWGATVKFESNKTNPNITVFGIDENYLRTGGYELEAGRNFSAQEVQYGAHAVILGNEVAKRLFGSPHRATDKAVRIGSSTYRVAGVLKEKGSSLGFGGDRICLLTLNNVRQKFSRPGMTYVINVIANDVRLLDAAVGEAKGVMRIVRRVSPQAEDTFEIVKSDNLANIVIENIRFITGTATVIGIITLLGAAIGLMNIMLVSVTERTREIGIRKATGASSTLIRWQFLTEAVMICLIGGALGILLGIPVGNIVSYFFGVGFIVPWLWIFLGITLCVATGLLSGIYPAAKAARLDPIESLRVE